MFCKHCGAKLDPDAKFCRGCGKPAEVPTPAPAVQPMWSTPAPAPIPAKKAQSGLSLLGFGLIGCLFFIGVGAVMVAVNPAATVSKNSTATAEAKVRAMLPEDATATAEAKIAATMAAAVAAGARAEATKTAQQAHIATVTGKFPSQVRVGGLMPWSFTVENQGEQPIVGVIVQMNEGLKKYTISSCVPKCVYSESFFGVRTDYKFEDTIAPGQSKSYTVNLSPNEPGNVKLTWYFYDGGKAEFVGTDNKTHPLSGDVAILR